MADDFEKKLLTDGGKWWEFLDPETYEVKADMPVATHSTADQLDWSRRDTTRPRGPVGFGFFVHCSDCGNPVPPDFTFCVRCGGEPRSSNRPGVFSLLITGFESEAAREAALELVSASGRELAVAEVEAIFDDPPAVFNLTAGRDQVAALVAKLAEVGIRARSFPVDDPSIPWIREAIESIARQTPKLVAAVMLVIGGLAASYLYSAIFLPIGLLAAGALVVHELGWYKRRYHLDARRLLELVTGFDAETARVARETLRSLGDREVREHVTVCLMEYYALTQQLRAHEPVYGAVLDNAREALAALMADVLTLAYRYARMDAFVAKNPPAALRQRIAALRARTVGDASAAQMMAGEVDALEDQLRTTEEMEQARGAFRDRIAALATSMELLRTRVASVRAQPTEDAWRALAIDDALRELDDEFEVFEETFASVR